MNPSTPNTSMNATAGRDGIAAALWCVALVGIVAAIVAALLAGARAFAGVALGAGIAVANLWAVGRIIRGVVAQERRLPWTLVALAKFSILFGLVAALATFKIVDLLALLIGYGALPIGIVAAQFGGAQPARGQG
jgi:ABC-type uncharacterized transport system permease subunit